MTRDGTVKIVDFGIAKILDRTGQQRSQVVKTVLDWLDERLGPVNPSSSAASR